MDDTQVVEMVREGNIDAFAEVVERYKSPITHYLFRMTGDYEVARDLAQDTFILALKKLCKTRTEILLKAWLYGIASNKALHFQRHKNILTFIPIEKLLKKDLPDINDQDERLDEKAAIETTIQKIPRSVSD